MTNDIDFELESFGTSRQHRTWFYEQLPSSAGRGDVIVIMKNPSWPDRGNACLAEARRMATDLEFSNLWVGNLFGRRSPRPSALNHMSYEDAVTEDNDLNLSVMADEVELVVAAWGGANGIHPERYRRRVTEVVDLLGPDRFTCFGTRRDGQPRHCYTWRFGRAPLEDWSPSTAW